MKFDKFPYAQRPWHEVLFCDWIVPLILAVGLLGSAISLVLLIAGEL